MLVSKYHGCGNDFIILRDEQVDHKKQVDFVVRVCDRHTGLGADGCIFVKQHPLEMIFYNCDGSRAPMCGNGLRCFANYCFDEGICTQHSFDVQTLAGCKRVEVLQTKPFYAMVSMGKAIYDLDAIHVRSIKSAMINYPLEIDGSTYFLYSFFMSTIHTVLFVDDAFAKHNEDLGERICHHSLFEEKTNVNFVEIIDKNTIRLQTYERGVGMTLACGTGACAAALMAYKEKQCNHSIQVLLRCGTLTITVNETDEVYMSGPATQVAKGEFYYD